jgi:transcriptional regulator with XRE-family HTH domain
VAFLVDTEDGHVGRRVREVRTWRRLSLTATAELAGMSASYLSLIERGLRPVTKRVTLESLAQALRVSPAELTGKPYAPTDRASSETHAAIAAITDALAGWWIGEVPDSPRRSWRDVSADLYRLIHTLQPNSDYTASAILLPGLIRDLLTAVAESEHRRAALAGLIDAYYAAGAVTGRFGFAGLPTLAVERMRQTAGELDDPVWSSFVDYSRAQFLSGTNRARQYELARMAAEMTDSRPEIRGMANLTAALAAAAQGQEDTAQTHLTEAGLLAELIDADVSPWAGNVTMQFGRTNVGIWRVAIGAELGHGAQVAEIASTVHPENTSRKRQTAFWIDYGRALVTERKTRERGLAALLHAEKLSPQQVHNNVFVREAVISLLTTARRDAGGRELRGLSYRLGIPRPCDLQRDQDRDTE